MVSPVFKTMFNGGFKEAKTNEVTLIGKKLVDVKLMLDYLYPDAYVCLTGKTHILWQKWAKTTNNRLKN